jgi:hypothetical protein
MSRAPIEGPILSGDRRFGALRNVGYTQLVQNVDLDFSNTTVGTSTYTGTSGNFVTSNTVPNVNGVVYQPSSSVYPSVVQTIPADTNTNIYRGAVFYLPYGCDLDNIYVDVAALYAVSGGTAAVTSQTVYVSNNYTAAGGTANYFATGAISAVGRQALATFTGPQILAQTATTADILVPNGSGTGPNASQVSQVVVTIAIVGTALLSATATTGRYNFTLQYTQPDNSIGTLTTYPYGNFD